jgi:DNA replicative helicase MCM subunit Mcm2 (Cdc46/Mcm family)
MFLNEMSPVLGETLLQTPDLILKHFDQAARVALRDKYEELGRENKESGQYPNLTIKNNIHVRIYSLPEGAAVLRQDFPSSKDTGTFLCILGTVIKTASPKLLEYARLYKCSKCRKTVDVEAPLEKWHAFPKKVDKCPNSCVDGKLSPVEDLNANRSKSTGGTFSKYKDYQEVKLQVGSSSKAKHCD